MTTEQPKPALTFEGKWKCGICGGRRISQISAQIHLRLVHDFTLTLAEQAAEDALTASLLTQRSD